MKSIAMAVVAMVFLVGCTHASPIQPKYGMVNPTEGQFPVRYDFKDVPAERRVEVSFHNQLEDAVCLTPFYQWPGNDGYMAMGSKGIVLIVEGRRFEGEKGPTEFCPECQVYVLPGETLTTSIPYQTFDLPEDLYVQEKKLEFAPLGYRCVKNN